MSRRTVALLPFSVLLLEAAAARIRVESNQNLTSRSPAAFGPDGEPWVLGTKYACVQKWQDGGIWWGKFVDEFCLVNVVRARKSIKDEHLHIKTDLSFCQSKKLPHRLKLCALKGKKNARLSYKTKVHVPKSCFLLTSESRYPVIEAGVSATECQSMEEWSPERQFAFATTTTTTPTTTTTTQEMDDNLSEICRCDDGLIVEGRLPGGACKCVPAPCDIVGTEGDGPSCHCMSGLHGHITWNGATPSGQCHAEAKSLFSSETSLWEHNGMRIKCCVSSSSSEDKPTKLQDLNADLLPSEGSLGRWERTGCGYMFGDTYHNGLKGAKPSCLVSVVRIMNEIAGDFEEVKELLNLGKTATEGSQDSELVDIPLS